MGLDRVECWWRMLRLSWFGHQSLLDLPVWVVFEGAPCITGHLPRLVGLLSSICIPSIQLVALILIEASRFMRPAPAFLSKR